MIKEAPKDFPAVSLFSDAPYTHTDCMLYVRYVVTLGTNDAELKKSYVVTLGTNDAELKKSSSCLQGLTF